MERNISLPINPIAKASQINQKTKNKLKSEKKTKNAITHEMFHVWSEILIWDLKNKLEAWYCFRVAFLNLSHFKIYRLGAKIRILNNALGFASLTDTWHKIHLSWAELSMTALGPPQNNIFKAVLPSSNNQTFQKPL